MVSGFLISPFERDKITSGEANIIVILEKSALGFKSFLMAIAFIFKVFLNE
jgi:hypothetical protein